jgi:hypothetical protein
MLIHRNFRIRFASSAELAAALKHPEALESLEPFSWAVFSKFLILAKPKFVCYGAAAQKRTLPPLLHWLGGRT